VTQAEGVGGKMTMRLTTVKGLRIGPYKFRNVPTFLFEDQFNVTSYHYLGGLIGNEILRRFNTILNYEKREIHITPNNSLKEPFDYAYTGLGIYFVNGRCVVEDVVEESPGEKAGFKSGDIIIGINSNLSNNITIYKSIMQHAVGKLRFLVSRDGEIILIYMKPSSILR
jgi:predicted metalloprotease with PDZ domain